MKAPAEGHGLHTAAMEVTATSAALTARAWAGHLAHVGAVDTRFRLDVNYHVLVFHW